MTSYKKDYELYNDKQLERKAHTLEKFPDEILSSKKLIGFQIWLNEFTAEIVNPLKIEKTKDAENQDVKQFAISMQIFILNFKRLNNALELTYSDSSESNYNLFRVVFESILFSFYLYNHSEETDEIYKFFNERFLDINTPSKKRKDCTLEELESRNRQSKYSPKNIRDSLYVDKQKESIKKIYSTLSTQSHVSIETINGSHYDYSEKRVREMLWYVKLLSYYNIVIFLDNLPDTGNIVHDVIGKNVLEFLGEVENMISENGNIGDFFPNHPNKKKSKLYHV